MHLHRPKTAVYYIKKKFVNTLSCKRMQRNPALQSGLCCNSWCALEGHCVYIHTHVQHVYKGVKSNYPLAEGLQDSMHFSSGSFVCVDNESALEQQTNRNIFQTADRNEVCAMSSEPPPLSVKQSNYASRSLNSRRNWRKNRAH